MAPFNAHTVDEDFFVSLCGTPEILRICGYGYGHQQQQPQDRIEAWLQNNIAIVVVGTMIFTAVLFYAYVLYRELYTAEPDLEQGIEDMAPHTKIGPASSAVVDALPVHRVTAEEPEANGECVICCSDFEIGDAVLTLPCQHKFNEACIRPWLLEKGGCPCCREELPLFFG